MKKFLNINYYLLPLILLAAKISFAQTRSGGEAGGGLGELPNPSKVTSIVDLLNTIINVLTYYIAAPVATLMVIIGAFQMLSAGGDPEKFSTGKKTITYALIGFGVLLIADVIIAIIQELLGVK